MKAFLTGSYAYGTPGILSDIDLAVLVDKETHKFLFEHREGKTKKLMFGCLNLVLFTEEERFLAWEKGTKELIRNAPVTKEQAIKKFTELGFNKDKADGSGDDE